jgi:hypothetical protein
LSSAFVRAYYGSCTAFERSVSLVHACFSGVWLGVLSNERRHAVDHHYYAGQRIYQTLEWNQQGLLDWEQRALEEHLDRCRHVLVLAAGGGREVLALEKRQIQALGLECHPDLVSFANELLRDEGFEGRVQLAPRDTCPPLGSERFDAAIVGWGAYMLVRGRRRRIALLRQIAAHLTPGATVFTSFFAHERVPRRMKVAARIGGILSRVTGGEPVEVGDYLVPNFVHFFTRREISEEFAAAGFELVRFEVKPYGHAVGRLVGTG